MPTDPQVPAVEDLRDHVLSALASYWPKRRDVLVGLPVPDRSTSPIKMPLSLRLVELPDWSVGAVGLEALLVPVEALGGEGDWKETDWWLAIFLLLEGWHERCFEQRKGEPIHSFSFRLSRWDERAWEAPWVNLIACFLRAWAGRHSGVDAVDLFGPLPAGETRLTHDVDAVGKTFAITGKQAAFQVVNALRDVGRLRPTDAGRRLAKATRMLFGKDSWDRVAEVAGMEEQKGLRGTFHFYSEKKSKSHRWLMDPGYDVATSGVGRAIADLVERGHEVGLHPGYHSWCDAPRLMQAQKALQEVSPDPVRSVRQHWLRFSWARTWSAQSQAGLCLDTTLMFNDRWGFRNSAAVEWSPWNPEAGCPHSIRVIPSVLMDSHLYDYRTLTSMERTTVIENLVEGVRGVGGTAAFLWHPQTLAAEYGWSQGFVSLLETLVPGRSGTRDLP